MHTVTRAPTALRVEHSSATSYSLRLARADRPERAQDVSVAVKRKRRARGLRLYHETWTAAKNLFVDLDRLENWDAWEHCYDHEIKSVKTGAELANKMLKSLEDKYTELEKPEGEGENSKNVEFRILPNNIGYLRIEDFLQRTTAKQVQIALRKLRQCASLIVDLRDNCGGYTDQAMDCAALLMSKGRVVTFRQRINRSENHRDVEISLKPDALMKTITSGGYVRILKCKRRYKSAIRARMPMVVLVDRNTASSAEILTAALQDTRRATVIGEKTFGKGIGQDFYPLPNGYQLGITTFYVITPDGYWAGDGHRDRVGIQPNQFVSGKGRIQRSSLKRDKQLYAAFQHLGGGDV